MDAVVLVLGDDTFLVREAVARTLEARPELEVSRFEGDRTEVARVLDELRTPTFAGGRRAVVVGKAADLLQGDVLQSLARYADRPAPGALLVLQARSLDRRLKGAKALAAAARVEKCDAPHDNTVAGWIRARAREAHGLRVGAEAARLLKERIGSDLGLLDSALGRLRTQVAPKTTLGPQDIRHSTDPQRSPAVFEAQNAVEAADLGAALHAVGTCFEEGIGFVGNTVTDETPISLILLNKLHETWRRCLRFHLLLEEGAAEDEALDAVRVSPKARGFVRERLRRHRLDRLLARHEHFMEADERLKRGEDGRR
ncbi:MAG: DNA polymerase III subunit delta, partial [Planctomycetota bacterium]